MQTVANRVLADLGLSEHQALLVAHWDREHPHVHIMVNRVHPVTGRAWDRWQDQPRIQQTLRILEREFGLREVAGRLYQLDGQEPPERAPLTNGERRQAERSGNPAFPDSVRAHLAELRAARPLNPPGLSPEAPTPLLAEPPRSVPWLGERAASHSCHKRTIRVSLSCLA